MSDTPPASLSQLVSVLPAARLDERLVLSRPARGGRQAAVLMLLSDTGGGPRIVLIEKTPHLRKHAGQIAFPGGAIEPGDPDAVAAALREAHEEVGVHPESVVVLGALPPAHVLASGFDVASVVGWWPEPSRLTPVDAREVAAVHQVPVEELVDPEARRTAFHPSGWRGPAFVIGDLFIWGFTGHLLDALLDLGGWSVPWDVERSADIPERFLHGKR